MELTSRTRVSARTCRSRTRTQHQRSTTVLQKAVSTTTEAARSCTLQLPLRSKALKEWAVTVSALGAGQQTVLLRKGGIKEPTFRPEAPDFFLFPTGFHTNSDLLKPGTVDHYAQEMAFDPKALIGQQMPLPVYAQVTGAWTTHDVAAFQLLDDLHVWAAPFVEQRLKWRAKQPVTILELRCWRLQPAPLVPVSEELFGCFSWVDLSLGAADVTAARPALSDSAFDAKQQLLRSQLQQIEATALDLP